MKWNMRKSEKRKEGLPIDQYREASLTVEAALIMPLFLFAMITFLYFIQIFIIQEHIQTAITKMGLNLSRTAYVYHDFISDAELINFDDTIFGTDYDLGLNELVGSVMNGSLLKVYAMDYLDPQRMNRSCIQDGYDGISFAYSKVLDDEDCIDIIVGYHIKIPIRLFSIGSMDMIQRVRLRAWTGYEVAPVYTMQEDNNSDETIVFITETGKVYHRSRSCSHIKLSVSAIRGVPNELRNNSGAKYKPCEACMNGTEVDMATYYITTEGTRYHSHNQCSKIKRTVKEISISQVDDRKPCKRCGN